MTIKYRTARSVVTSSIQKFRSLLGSVDEIRVSRRLLAKLRSELGLGVRSRVIVNGVWIRPE